MNLAKCALSAASLIFSFSPYKREIALQRLFVVALLLGQSLFIYLLNDGTFGSNKHLWDVVCVHETFYKCSQTACFAIASESSFVLLPVSTTCALKPECEQTLCSAVSPNPAYGSWIVGVKV